LRSVTSDLLKAVVILFVLQGCSGTRVQAGDSKLAANVEAFAAQLADRDEFSGVVLFSRRGNSLLRRGYGLADRKTGRLNTPETPFALSSVSKMFTAVTIAKLVERNQLSFDNTLGEILPTYPSPEARDQIKLHHLLTMSSGIPDLFRVPEFWAGIGAIKTPEDFWQYFAGSPLQFPPGTRWAYSNSNFLLLGAVIEKQTGRAFTSVVEEEVFRPLSLSMTSYDVKSSWKPAIGYTRTANSSPWQPAWEEPKPGDDFVVGSPMGGGYSTVDDLAKFAEALMAHKLLTREMTDRILTGAIDAEYGGRHGYGFETRQINGINAVGHHGALAGSSNHVEFYPDLGYVLVILGNTDSGTEDITTLVRRELMSSEVP
jgi:CubicO group peptidase (beta-lactamase class C family)